jgi:hypothetical protein
MRIRMMNGLNAPEIRLNNDVDPEDRNGESVS